MKTFIKICRSHQELTVFEYRFVNNYLTIYLEINNKL